MESEFFVNLVFKRVCSAGHQSIVFIWIIGWAFEGFNRLKVFTNKRLYKDDVFAALRPAE
jgi:hypothetical protein